jgi:hypothetical protein
MKPYIATLILSVVLIAMSAWAYFGSDTPSATALIPLVSGVTFGLLSIGVKKENKVVAHIAVLLALLLAVALLMPLKGAIGRSDPAAIARVSIMILALIGTLVVYIRSFIQARKDRPASD